MLVSLTDNRKDTPVKILDKLYDLALRAYAPRQKATDFKPDLVISSEYCLLRDDSLPEASVLCLKKAQRFAGSAKIAWGSTDYLGSGYQSIDILKKAIVPNPTYTVVSNNTVEEAAKLCEIAIIKNKKRILVICDRPHRPRMEMVYRHFLKGANVKVAFRTIKSRWDSPHYSWIQSNRWTWLAGNIAHHTLLHLRGVEAMRKVRQ